MNQLAPIAITMTSLELVQFINNQRAAGEPELRHDDFMRKCPKVLGEEGVRKFADTYRNEQNGQTYPCYTFPKREACLMAMSYSYDLQAKVFDKMTELEAAAAPAPALLPDFTNPVAAARAWADQVEAKNLLQIENTDQAAKLAIAGPKVEFADAMLNSDGTVLVRDAAKTIGAPVRKLERALRDKGVILANNAPAARYVTKGYFKETTVTVLTKTRGNIMRHTARVTAKGMEFLRRFVQRHAGLFSAQGSRA